MQSLGELPVSRIKVRIPVRRRELISRTRLIDSIYDQLEKRLISIVAPAGYGKTSLLVDLAQSSELPICWLSLDTLDQEPQRFLIYLIAAIREQFPNFGRDSLSALESMASFEEDEERLLITITNEINAQVNEHFVLVLDDYHLVGNVLIISHLVSRFLQLAGENVHLILAARNLPTLPDTPLLIARNQIGGLSFEELSFRPEEIQQFFQQNEGSTLTLEDAAALVRETEGWIAAIHLTHGRPGSLPALHPLQSTRELFDFFSTEVLHRQPEQMQRFMLMTSLFDTFDVALCDEVLTPLLEGESFDWLSFFATVQTRNLFVVPYDNEGRWIRYHHLFQHFLKSKLQYEQPALAWHIQQKLGQAYEKRQAWEEALQVYEGLDDHANLARVLVQAGLAFVGSGRIFTLASWLDKVPRDVIYSQPALLSLLGTVHASRGDTREALEFFNLAEAKLRGSEDKIEWTLALVRRGESYRQLGDFTHALADIEKALEVTRESDLTKMQDTFAEAHRYKGLILFGLGQFTDALMWLQEALRLHQILGITATIPILETELGVVYRRLGKPEIAARYYVSALQAWENAGNTGWKARLLNNLALLYHMTGRLDEALPLLEKALYTAEQSGYVRIQTNILISLGDLLADLGDLDSAYDYYNNAMTLASHLGNSLLIFYASLGQARLCRLRGDYPLAFDELRRVEIAQVKMGLYERAIYNLELGCCRLEASQIDQAIEVLRDSVRLLEQGGNQMEWASAQLWLAVALSQQDPEEAVAKLREALPPAREWQRPSPLIIHANRARQCLKALNSGVLKDALLKAFFQQAEQVSNSLSMLLRQIRRTSDIIKPTVSDLHIISFGEVQVLRDQRAVNLSDWQTREARDLFFFLLHSGPLTKEQIALAFWPDISPGRLKMRFKINVYRIRKALGQDVILFEDERYRFNRAIKYVWDREKFDELLQGARRMPASAENAKLLEEVSTLVRGPYLADVDGDWAVAQRLKCQEAHQEAMLELAQIYLTLSEVQKCMRTARLVLQSDSLLEGAHRLIIQAYACLHDPAGMTRQYHQYQQDLAKELGLQPSSELNSLYRQLLDTI